MGFKDAEWAYALDLPSTAKVVLVAICHRADDKSHATFVGRKMLANMLGMNDRSVTRALGVLEAEGIIRRTERRRKSGYRDTDLIVVNRSWTPSQGTRSQVTESHLTQSQVTESPSSGDSVSDLRGHSVEATDKSVVTQGSVIDHSTRARTFDEFYAIWPKKVDKPAALRAWAKAIKRHEPTEIINAATAYRDNPNLPSKQFIRNPATWLNGDGWDDELPGPRDGKQTPTERAMQTHQAGQRVAARRSFGNITSLTSRQEITA